MDTGFAKFFAISLEKLACARRWLRACVPAQEVVVVASAGSSEPPRLISRWALTVYFAEERDVETLSTQAQHCIRAHPGADCVR